MWTPRLRDQLLASQLMGCQNRSSSDTESDNGMICIQLDITPPSNEAWATSGFSSEVQLNHALEENLSYLRQVLLYLRASWDTPLNSDIEESTRVSRRTYRHLNREIGRFYEKLEDSQLTIIEAKHQIFLEQRHSLWERGLEMLSNQHLKVVAKNKIKKARISRTELLDAAMDKIQLQYQSIYFRSAGLEQW
ncbi:hypothetical protein NLU13_4340 [Sarocladium strictum]|uniref:Uncharacterized protein n=1 Tax=Sarocladium strictum TaxID=5046 RepID=A0AA39L833_SARSR|nr:hypothetical protein NLU13_4340 [Sarocladium strictum]